MTKAFNMVMQLLDFHPAGDVTRVSVMPRKVTVKIGDAENRCQDVEIKSNEKG